MMAINARHEVPRRQGQSLAKISRCILEIVPALALAETTTAGVLPASLGERRLIGAIPAKCPKGAQACAALPCWINCRVYGSPASRGSLRDKVPPLPQSDKGTSVESDLRSNTLCNSGGAWRRSETGNRASTLKIDLACAPVRAATHLSYLTDRC